MGPLANCLDWSGERLGYLLDTPDQVGIIKRPGFRQAQSEFRQNEAPINTTWEEIGNGLFKKCFSYQSLARSASFILTRVHSNGQRKGFACITLSHSKWSKCLPFGLTMASGTGLFIILQHVQFLHLFLRIFLHWELYLYHCTPPWPLTLPMFPLQIPNLVFFITITPIYVIYICIYAHTYVAINTTCWGHLGVTCLCLDLTTWGWLTCQGIHARRQNLPVCVHWCTHRCII